MIRMFECAFNAIEKWRDLKITKYIYIYFFIVCSSTHKLGFLCRIINTHTKKKSWFSAKTTLFDCFCPDATEWSISMLPVQCSSKKKKKYLLLYLYFWPFFFFLSQSLFDSISVVLTKSFSNSEIILSFSVQTRAHPKEGNDDCGQRKSAIHRWIKKVNKKKIDLNVSSRPIDPFHSCFNRNPQIY